MTPCNDTKLQKLCTECPAQVPLCDGVKRTVARERARERGKILWGRATCVDLFELRKELLKTGHFEFKAISWCMFPVLKKGDVLKIEHALADDMKIDDIPAYRSGDRLFAHRVVGKEVINGRKYIITRPDMSDEAQRRRSSSMAKADGAGEAGNPKNGERIPEEDILGRIKEVERGGRTFTTERRKANLADRILYKKAKIEAHLARFFREAATAALAKIQNSAIYRRISGKIAKKMMKYLNFDIVLPSEGKLGIYKYFPLEKFDISKLGNLKLFHMRMRVKNTPLGCANLIVRTAPCPYQGAWIGDFYVRLRFRGMGFEQVLLDKTNELLKQNENKSAPNR